jgi:hypothetical protein
LSEKQSIELQFAPSSQGDYRVPGLRENVKEIPVKSRAFKAKAIFWCDSGRQADK